MLPLALLLLACTGMRSAMTAADEWAGSRLRAILMAAAGCALAWTVISAGFHNYHLGIAGGNVPPEYETETDWAIGILLIASAVAGFARSAFYRPMPLDRALAAIEKFATSLQNGERSGDPVVLQRAVQSLERLPLNPEYKAGLLHAPALARARKY